MKNKPLGSFELMTMMTLTRIGQNAYGMTVRRELQDRLGRAYSIGAVYQTLERLEKKGLVKSRVGEAEETRGGRARKFFEVTGAGQKSVAATLKDIEALKGAYTVPTTAEGQHA